MLNMADLADGFCATPISYFSYPNAISQLKPKYPQLFTGTFVAEYLGRTITHTDKEVNHHNPDQTSGKMNIYTDRLYVP